MADREGAVDELVSRGYLFSKITLDCIGAVVLSGTPLEA